MQQHSIFEPLFPGLQLAPKMELMSMERQASAPPAEQAFNILAPGLPHSWFTDKTPPLSTTNCIGIRRASSSSLPFFHTTHAPIASSPNLPIHIPKLSSTPISEQETSSLEYISAQLPKTHDDGSVAIKLLSSITKSLSSPSLHLASSKEVARETSYQKSLKLKHMKLQHCAEALGMESSDSLWSSTSSLSAGNGVISQSIEQAKPDMIGNLSSWPSSVPPKITNQEYSLPSVKSAPKLSAPPMMMTSQRSKYMRCTSFPPPLSHTLPASPFSACDSLSLSLRSYRQDGRLVLKEVMVPSKNYFQANRRDGRLTLHVLTRDLDEEEKDSGRQYHEHQGLLRSSESCPGLADAMLMNEEEMKLKESMISLDQTTQLEVGNYGNEIVCTNTNIHPSVEGASVKASVHNVELLMTRDATQLPNIAAKVVTMKRVCIAAHGGDQTFANTGVAEATNFLNLRRMQCNIHFEPHGHLHRLGDLASRSVMSNILSNVIALTLQTTHSKFTLQKTQVINSLHSPRYPLPSSTRPTDQLTVLRPPGYKRHLLASSHHDMSTLPESKENFIWESNLLPSCVEASASHKSMRRGVEYDASSFVLEELDANSLMKLVTGLPIVGVRCDVGEWCTLADRRKPSNGLDNNSKLTETFPSDIDASTILEAYNATARVTMGGGVMGGGVMSGQAEYIANNIGNGINAQHGFINHHDEEKVGIGMNEASKEASLSSNLYSASALPSAPAYLQSDEWLHTLHCKELSDRNKFGICSFMQPHSANCIATRS
ncbi:hypothetical protein GOP47_0001054 [Adiantum capillus-veneris]|uniref:FAF domain-containing protein n=1 Tax=Adiantum capillus-veneris TaxID=13818 RepID=A0A9D4VE46_ADICA|nr:hypothetical protein GOP47_0001054 [Adiantum capillus-veneris]